MVKPRTAPHGGKPHTAPEFQHSILSQAEQAKLLGRSDETTRNLGHPSSEDRLMEHPLDKVQDYQNHASEKIVRGPPRSQGVYRRFKNPQSGIANEANLGKWASYAHSNSYAGGHGAGVEPTMPDPRGRHSNESDGYLAPLPSASTESWADFRAGSESGEGRLEKLHKR